MKKSERMLGFVIVLAVMLMITIGIQNVIAADAIMSGKVLSATQKITKNGEPYVILVIPEAKELSGVKYTAETSVFCFKNEAAMKLKQGDLVKFVAKRTVSKDGNEFVTMIQLIK